MFLAPSSSRAADLYLQTLLLRVSLSRLGGKHRQRVRWPLSLLATWRLRKAPPSSSAHGSASPTDDSHLTNLPTLMATSSESSNNPDGSGDHGIMFLLSVKTHRQVATGNMKSREVTGALAGTSPSSTARNPGTRRGF